MQFSLKNTLIILSLSLFSVLKAQIYSDIAVGHPVTYPDSGTPDSLFVFSVNDETKSIVAHLPDSAKAKYEWSYFNTATKDYVVMDSDSAEVWVIDTITSTMGYRLVINNNKTYYCWVIIHDFKVEITSTFNDTISNSDINCRTISYIKAEVTEQEQSYYNPLGGPGQVPIKYLPTWKREWGSNQPGADVPRSSSLQTSIENPYWKDTWYNITVTNSDSKQKSKDSAFYKSVRPHAEFAKPIAIPLDDSVYYPGKDPWYYEDAYKSNIGDSVSAPAKFLFDRSLSENADSYTWIFGDSAISPMDEDTVLHRYELPGTYYAYLVAKKNVDFLYDPCYDTFPKVGIDEDPQINEIIVNNVQSMPDTGYVNVFTSKHKYGWRLNEDVSIEGIEIAIYNRYGQRVHYYKGNYRDWPGWDGSNNGKKKVSTGVYFFVIKNMKSLPDFQTGELPSGLTLLKKGFIHYYNLDD